MNKNGLIFVLFQKCTAAEAARDAAVAENKVLKFQLGLRRRFADIDTMKLFM